MIADGVRGAHLLLQDRWGVVRRVPQGGKTYMKFSAILVSAVLSTGALVSVPAYVAADDKPITVVGEIVRYEPGKVIVLRDAGNKEVTYTLTPSITIPTGVEVGRRVTLYTTHGADGAFTVTRVSTSVTPEGNLQRTVERTHTNPAGETTRTTTTTINGTVQAYEPGRSVTITRSDGTQVTYMLNERTHLPEGLAVGRTIVLRPAVVTDDSKVADTITYTETKTQVKKGRTTTKTKTKTKQVGSN
jgi:hypothetical protein